MALQDFFHINTHTICILNSLMDASSQQMGDPFGFTIQREQLQANKISRVPPVGFGDYCLGMKLSQLPEK
jgi:hypothetical protein